MEVVHVLPAFTKGGAEKVVVELANTSARKGHKVTIVAGWPVEKSWLQNSLDESIKVLFVAKDRGSAFRAIMPWIIKNKHWLFNCDIIHCHLSFGTIFGTLVFLLRRLSFTKKNFKIVETNHSVGMPVSASYNWFQKQMFLFRDAVVLMAKDEYWERYKKKHPRLKVVTIYNGISLPVAGPQNLSKDLFLSKYNIPASTQYIIGTIGMLRPERIPGLYVRLFEDIYKQLGDKVQFIMGGDGVEFQNIQNMLADKPFQKNFHMIGLVQYPADVLQHLNLYISLSVGSTAGISMIEAAFCNVPVLGFQLLKDYEAESGDWVWSANDEANLAEKAIELLKNPGELNRYAEKQRNYCDTNFSAEAMYQSYLTLYTQA